ncbi:MAG: rhomboid family intramembrane serine protease [Anaerolineales bacterium]|nr:rhomboid family intramembrane serine protease [Anaerolineales bacterium]MCX7755699.1 rhomboid family intramembrane serine protease [Anaerolineales bacterium]MDW8277700.1 rhomboid family intramembrane serine protease [Anaerolineales bacterium]
MIPIRDENPTRRVPFVNYALIVLNVLVFLWQVSLGPAGEVVLYRMALIPLEVTRGFDVGDLRSLLTSMFMHAGLLHLLGNMLYLWIFGDNVEDALGHARYLFFYLAGGAAASLTHVFLYPLSQVPTVGASGAIAATLGAYLLLFPHRRVVTLIPFGFFLQVARLPAVIVLGMWFLLELVQGTLALGMEQLGGVAFWAHIGGFVFGMLVGPRLRLRPRPVIFYGDWSRW